MEMEKKKSNSFDLRQDIIWGRSSKNIGYFHLEFQDINIYVEDTAKGSEELYKALMKNIFPNQKINNIICLGGRTNVIEACKIKENKLKELYIIDGDLNLLYEPCLKMKGLFHSQVYCMENYMIDETALATLLEETLALNLDEAKRCLDWETFIFSMKDAFLEIFILYAVSHSLSNSEKTIKRFNPNTWINHSVKKGEYKSPNKSIIENESETLKSSLTVKFGDAVINRKIQEIKTKVNQMNDEDILDFFSGKNYLLPFVINYLSHKGVPEKVIPGLSLKYRLIKASKHKRLVELTTAIKEVVQNGEFYPK